MLTPEYINSLPDYMMELWGQAESDILQDMARRINGFDLFIPSAKYQMQVLEEMGMVRENIVRSLSSITGKTERELATLMRDAGIESLQSDDAVYRRAGLNPAPLRASYHLQSILQTGLAKTMGEFENLTRTTANTATRQFERALDRAYMQITTGGMDYNSAIRSAVKDLSRNGIATVTYPSGHTDYMDVAVRRATVTGVNQTLGRMQEARARELGWDLMELTAHSGARPEHAEWQGEIVSLSGATGYLSTAEIGYGTGPGFKGWNCNHDWRPYDPAMPRTYSQELLEDYKAQNYEYNGQKMTQYEALQAQRQIERNIRRWKRENLAMNAAGQPTAQSAAKLKEWRDRERDFLAQTGLKRQYDRSMVTGFGRSEAARAVVSAKHTLTIRETAAIKRYISSEAYTINERLRSGAKLSALEQEFVNTLDSALSKMPKYRGIVSRSLFIEFEGLDDLLTEMSENSKIIFPAYTSSSTGVYDANDDVRLIIRSKTGADLREANKSEMEILFKRDTEFRVTRCWIEGEKIFYELEEV